MTPQTKKSLDRIHAKYYGKKKRDAKVMAGSGSSAGSSSSSTSVSGLSRNELMLMAKKAGIKYFRIMTKEELAKVLDLWGGKKEPNKVIGIMDIQKVANARWKSGWGKKSKAVCTGLPESEH